MKNFLLLSLTPRLNTLNSIKAMSMILSIMGHVGSKLSMALKAFFCFYCVDKFSVTLKNHVCTICKNVHYTGKVQQSTRNSALSKDKHWHNELAES